MSDYYEKIFISGNPLITELFEKYRTFKERKLIKEGLAINSNGLVNLDDLNLIRQTNLNFLASEKHATILCGARDFIKNFIIDFNGFGPVGTAYR